MCHAVPARVIEILGSDSARVLLGGARQVISTALVDDVQPGDYVIVHVGYALGRMDADAARATLADMAGAAEPGGAGGAE